MQGIERGRIAVWAACAAVIVFLAARWMLSGQATRSRSGSVATLAGSRRSAGAAEGEAGVHGDPVVVQLAGMVRHPGVYRVPFGSRVYQAIGAAGGATPSAALQSLNLASRVSDGQRIDVPRRGSAAAAASQSRAIDPAAQGSVGPVSLSQASAAQLDSLEGIGPALAARIVRWRESHGGFRTVGDLDQVPGIGPAKLQALRQSVVP